MATKKVIDYKSKSDNLLRENERLKVKIEMLEAENERLRKQPVSYEAYSAMHDSIEAFCKR